MSDRKVQTYPERKRFGGKIYDFHDGSKKKSVANKRAKHARENGVLARVTKVNKNYAVYIRKKGR